MARPIKDNADYFSHDSDMRNDVKVKSLRHTFGLGGYAFWCMMLEVLTNEDFFEYSYDEKSLRLLASDFDIEYELFSKMLDHCIYFDLIQVDIVKNVLYSENHRSRFTGLVEKRERDREYRQNRRKEVEKSSSSKQKQKSNGNVLSTIDDVVDALFLTFTKFYKENKGVAFIPDNEELLEFKDLVNRMIKFRNVYVKEKDELFNIDELNKTFIRFLNIAMEDKYIKKVFTINMLNKQFNQISSRCVEKKVSKNSIVDNYSNERDLSLSNKLYMQIRNTYMEKHKEELKGDGKELAIRYGKDIEKDYLEKITELNLPNILK